MERMVLYTIEGIQQEIVTIKAAQGDRRHISVSSITRRDGSAVSREEIYSGLAVMVSLSATDSVLKVLLGAASLSGPFSKPVGPATISTSPLSVPIVSAGSSSPEPPTYSQLRREFSLAVITYSRRIYPTKFLKESYEYDSKKKFAMKLIKQKCVGVRKCNAGDINGFWLALAVGYMELLTKESTPITYLTRYISRVESLQTDGQLLTTLKQIHTLRSTPNSSTSQWISGPLSPLSNPCASDSNESTTSTASVSTRSNQSFWLEHAEFLRVYVTDFLTREDCLSLSDQRYVNGSDMDAATIRLMLELDRENGTVSDIIFHAAAQALDIQIVIFTPEIGRIKERYIPQNSAHFLYLCLFRDNVVFHLLYTQAQITNMGYNITQGHWENPQPETLYAHRKSKGTVRSALENRLIDAYDSLKKKGNTLQMLQPVIKDALENAIFTDELRGLALNFLYNLHVFRKNVLEISDDFEGKSEVLQICDSSELVNFLTKRVSERPGCVMTPEHIPPLATLPCGHQLCFPCIKPLIMDSTLTTLCPLCGSFFPQKIISLDHVIPWKREPEYQNSPKKCWKCMHLRSKNYFRESFCESCRSDMCLVCFGRLYNRVSSHCDCGAALTSYPHKQWLDMVTLDCGCCGARKGVLDFTNEECEGHIVCRMCLTGKASCPICHRAVDLG